MRYVKMMILAAVTAFYGVAWAQEAAPPAKPIDLDFKGGTAAEFVAAVQKASPETNVAVMTDLSVVAMPPVSLKRVDAGTAIELLRVAPRQQGNRSVVLEVGRFSDPHTEIITVSGQTIASGHEPLPMVRVLMLREVVSDEVDQEAVLSVLQAGLDMVKTPTINSELKFHEATGLLIVKGSDQQLEAADNLFAQLQLQKQRWEQKKQLASEEVIARQELTTREQELAELRKRLANREDQIRQLQAELKAAINPASPR